MAAEVFAAVPGVAMAAPVAPPLAAETAARAPGPETPATPAGLICPPFKSAPPAAPACNGFPRPRPPAIAAAVAAVAGTPRPRPATVPAPFDNAMPRPRPRPFFVMAFMAPAPVPGRLRFMAVAFALVLLSIEAALGTRPGVPFAFSALLPIEAAFPALTPPPAAAVALVVARNVVCHPGLRGHAGAAAYAVRHDRSTA